MKKILLLIAITTAGLFNHAFAQKNSESKPLQKVLTAYLNLKEALVKNDSIKAQTIATSLCTAIDTVNIDKLTLMHKKAWTKYSNRLEKESQKIKEATTLNEQRNSFKSLSLSMHKLLGRLNINKVILYYQYCEDANAYWVSADSVIKNPYYGKQQLDCGYTKEILKAHK